MIRRSPCEVYLKFLVTNPENMSVDRIRENIKSCHLDYPSDEYVLGLREQLSPPSIFRPNERTHAQSFNFLLRHKLIGFYHVDDASMLAHRYMLQSARAKELIETSTIAGDTPAAIANRLKAMNIPSTSEAIQRYQLYYWNLSLVDSVELNALLQMRYTRDGVGGANDGELSPYQKLQKNAMKEASYKDPRITMARIASTPVAGILNQMREGFMPTRADVSKMASALRVAAIARAFEGILEQRPDAISIQSYALTAKLMSEVIESVGDPSAGLQKQLQQLSVRTDTERVPTLLQLSAGRHTTDLGPRIVDGQPVKENTSGK